MTDKTQTAGDEKPVARKEVKLKRPHTHAGVEYREPSEDGSFGTISVTPRQQKYLSERGII